MKKKGFTLQETLITLGIIGVIAALTIPMIVKMKPNETETRYLKAYNTLAKTTSDLVGDSSLYWQTYDNNGNPECFGLDCKKVPIAENIPANVKTAIAGNADQKFARLFANKVNTINDISCNGTVCTFDTIDGTRWSIDAAKFPIKVSFNIKPDDAKRNCTASSTCKDPALFDLYITKAGKIRRTDGNDDYTIAVIPDNEINCKEGQIFLNGSCVDSNPDGDGNGNGDSEGKCGKGEISVPIFDRTNTYIIRNACLRLNCQDITNQYGHQLKCATKDEFLVDDVPEDFEEQQRRRCERDGLHHWNDNGNSCRDLNGQELLHY